MYAHLIIINLYTILFWFNISRVRIFLLIGTSEISTPHPGNIQVINGFYFKILFLRIIEEKSVKMLIYFLVNVNSLKKNFTINGIKLNFTCLLLTKSSSLIKYTNQNNTDECLLFSSPTSNKPNILMLGVELYKLTTKKAAPSYYKTII